MIDSKRRLVRWREAQIGVETAVDLATDKQGLQFFNKLYDYWVHGKLNSDYLPFIDGVD